MKNWFISYLEWRSKNMGTHALSRNQFPQAAKAFNNAVRRAPKNSEHHWHLGSALYAQQQYSTAEASYRKAIEIAPETPRYHGDLGIALHRQGQNISGINESIAKAFAVQKGRLK